MYTNVTLYSLQGLKYKREKFVSNLMWMDRNSSMSPFIHIHKYVCDISTHIYIYSRKIEGYSRIKTFVSVNK